MSTEPRFLYSVTVPDSDFRTCVDGMRVILKPTVKHVSHVTVRGPYPTDVDVSGHVAKIKGAIVRVSHAGRFFSKPGAAIQQNTVYLNCSCPPLLGVWDKPDYDYNPHLTVYNGHSREIGAAVYDILDQFPFRYSFSIAGFDRMVLGEGPPASQSLDFDRLSTLIGEDIPVEGLKELTDAQRLTWVEKIMRHLASLPDCACGQPTCVAATV